MKHWLLRLSSSTLAFLAGCGDKGDTNEYSTDYGGWSTDYTGWVAEDADEDGYTDNDCDDDDPAVHPGATEVCDDTVDNDCDSFVDGDDTDCTP